MTTNRRHELSKGVKIKRNGPMPLHQSGACAGDSGRRSLRSMSTAPQVAARGFVEGGHQLEKLEFALAVAMTRGEESRSRLLREQIDALGGNVEEPGT